VAERPEPLGLGLWLIASSAGSTRSVMNACTASLTGRTEAGTSKLTVTAFPMTRIAFCLEIGSRAMAGPHDAPTAAELITAVREFLERDVIPAATGRVRFHGLVAANVLGMVERELELGDRHAAEHAGRLTELGFQSDAELAAALRDGTLDDRYVQVRAALLASVAAKLEVANPGYDGLTSTRVS
jgi:hypothetical protein